MKSQKKNNSGIIWKTNINVLVIRINSLIMIEGREKKMEERRKRQKTI